MRSMIEKKGSREDALMDSTITLRGPYLQIPRHLCLWLGGVSCCRSLPGFSSGYFFFVER
jgi:hypothetical protein